jgi:hypothetical protein
VDAVVALVSPEAAGKAPRASAAVGPVAGRLAVAGKVPRAVAAVGPVTGRPAGETKVPRASVAVGPVAGRPAGETKEAPAVAAIGWVTGPPADVKRAARPVCHVGPTMLALRGRRAPTEVTTPSGEPPAAAPVVPRSGVHVRRHAHRVGPHVAARHVVSVRLSQSGQ